MDSFSEVSSEDDPFHDSDNSDIDPDYVVDEGNGKKIFKKCLNKSLYKVGSVSDQHGLNYDNKQGNFIKYLRK